MPGHWSLETADLINGEFHGSLKMLMWVMNHEKIQYAVFPRVSQIQISCCQWTVFSLDNTALRLSRGPFLSMPPPRNKTSGFREAWYGGEHHEKAGFFGKDSTARKVEGTGKKEENTRWTDTTEEAIASSAYSIRAEQAAEDWTSWPSLIHRVARSQSSLNGMEHSCTYSKYVRWSQWPNIKVLQKGMHLFQGSRNEDW